MTRTPKKKSFQAHMTTREVPWYRPDQIPVDLPRPIVVVNGAFDLLHSGHMKIIQAARQHGSTVVCALDADARVARKGEGRPIQSFVERMTTLSYLPIDAVVEIEEDRDMAVLFRRVKPDLRVQGWDYHDKPSKFDVPKCFVREGKMRTSEIITRCKRCGE